MRNSTLAQRDSGALPHCCLPDWSCRWLSRLERALLDFTLLWSNRLIVNVQSLRRPRRTHVVAVAWAIFGAVCAAQSEYTSASREEVVTLLPHNFPVPDDCRIIERSEDGFLTEVGGGFSFSELVDYFEYSLRTRGFLILARDDTRIPPLELRTAYLITPESGGETFSLTVQLEDKRVGFEIRGLPGEVASAPAAQP